MFWVVEIQNNNGTWAHLITSHATREEAESKWHTILGFAAVSDLTAHGAVMFDDEGVYFRREVYERGAE